MARQIPFMRTATSRGSSAAVFLCTASLSCLIMWLPVGLPMIESLGAGLLGAMLLGVLLARVVGSVKFNSIAPVMLFAACSVTSMWLSPLSEISFRRGGLGLFLVLVFPAAQVVASSARGLIALRLACGITVLLCAIDIAWQPMFGASLIRGVPAPIAYRRYEGSLPNPNEAAFLAVLMPLAITAISPLTFARVARSWWSVMVALAALIGALLTGSRAILAALVVGACARSMLGTRVFARALIVLVLMFAAVAWIGDIGAFRRRVSDTLAPQNEPRLRTWNIAWDAFLERPMLGQGPAVFFEINEASRLTQRAAGWETPAGGMPWVHSVPLELLCERGVIGFAAMVLVIACVVRDLRKAAAQPATRAWAAALTGSAVALAAMSLVDLSLLKDWCSIVWWLVAGLAAGLATSAAATAPTIDEPSCAESPPSSTH